MIALGLLQIIESYERLERDGHGITKLNIAGKERLYMITAEEYGTRSNTYTWFEEPQMLWKSTLQEIITAKTRSKEQIAAEESVAKAKEALEAAENALKVVKEQSK